MGAEVTDIQRGEAWRELLELAARQQDDMEIWAAPVHNPWVMLLQSALRDVHEAIGRVAGHEG